MTGARTLGALGLGEAVFAGGLGPATEVSGLVVDSRRAGPGTLFFALPGAVFDGADHAAGALAAGAAGVVTGAAGAAKIAAAAPGAPVATVADPRLALARAAAAWHGAQPAVIAAVTGTNGKTSVAAFLRQVWAACGRAAVNFGTAGVEGAETAPIAHTTPEPLTLHALLADLAAKGVTHAAMEASSHGLDQRRLDGVRLAAGGFTNLTRDHLDYHETPEAYAAAKLGLFERVLPEGAAAVANADDGLFPRIRQIAARRGLALTGVGRSAAAEVQILGASFHAAGQTLRVRWGAAPARAVELPLVGAFQGENALLAAALAVATGEAPEAALAALPGLSGVRGRMERVAGRPNGAAVYVDYAHTPEAVATALSALRPHTPGRLVAILGAGGDRDAGKRPLMGRAAAEGADAVIVTDDNPRSEDPAAIRAAVMAGCPEATEIGDRAEAILAGVDMLGPGDRLLIAGKGHETGQTLADRTIPFDDAEQARAAVRTLDGGDAT